MTEVFYAAGEGLLFALSPVCFVVFAALFTYGITLESGAMEVMKKGLTGLSNDRRILALLIAWGFGNFMEGMAGFGTAVAIPAAILAGIGFNPLKAVLICLVANTTPTAFGSVGVPLLTLAHESGVDVKTLATKTAFLQAAHTALGPVLILLVLDGWKALKGVGIPLMIASVGFLIPWILSACTLGCELPNILGGLVVMIALSRVTKKESAAHLREQVYAWSPFGCVVLVLGLNALLPPFIKQWTTPGALVLVAGFVGGRVQKLSVKTEFKLLLTTLVRYRKAFIKICAILMIARILVSLGWVGAVADALVAGTGAAYPFFAPLVGALGGFVTGSGTSSCVLFGCLQADAAAALSLSPDLLAAANVYGAGIGKMICPQSIAIGAAAAGLTAGAESLLFKKALPWFLGVLLAACLLVGLLAFC